MMPRRGWAGLGGARLPWRKLRDGVLGSQSSIPQTVCKPWLGETQPRGTYLGFLKTPHLPQNKS